MHLSVRRQIDPPQNTKYEEDIVYVTKHNKWVLNSIGMWPVVAEGIDKFLPKIIIGFSNLVSLFTVVQCILHIILEEKDALLRLRLLGLACFASINLLKYWAVIVRKPNIEYCIKQVQTDWKQVSRAKNKRTKHQWKNDGHCYLSVLEYSLVTPFIRNPSTFYLI